MGASPQLLPPNGLGRRSQHLSTLNTPPCPRDDLPCHLPALPSCLSYPCSLCSSNGGLLAALSTHQAWSCPRAFAQAVPASWNALLPDLSMAPSLLSFRSLLTGHLLSEAFPEHPVYNCKLPSLPNSYSILLEFSSQHLEHSLKLCRQGN